ncbi:hypothetical protein SUX59_06535, partial [Streptococcus agalactiae]
ASPDSLTSGSLVINELVALDLTMCEKKEEVKSSFYHSFSNRSIYFIVSSGITFLLYDRI